ncbi:MAG: hypothetical protein K8T89_20260 [Planctomycetes bacterium]|nr:hypothetical protein [Planctomycetota bacterium]
MSKGVITFFFDEGQVFQESWEMMDVPGETLAARLKRLAKARLPLLATCVRIVQLKADGHPLERVNLRGSGGLVAAPRAALALVDGSTSLNILLRGVPEEVFVDGTLTAVGQVAFQKFSKTVSDCGCVNIRKNEVRPIMNLEPFQEVLLSNEATKKATRQKLNSLLGKEETDRFWYSPKNIRGNE